MVRRRSRQAHVGSSTCMNSRFSMLAILTLCSESNGFMSPLANGVKSYRKSTRTIRLPLSSSNGEQDNALNTDEGSKKQSLSKDKAISALSQPKDGTGDLTDQPIEDRSDGSSDESQRTRSFSKAKRNRSKSNPSPPLAAARGKNGIDRDFPGRKSTNQPSGNGERNEKGPSNTRGKGKASLLPPPLSNLSDDDLTSGLSSWEEFLGQTNVPITPSTGKAGGVQLPAISELFPTSLSTTAGDKPLSTNSSTSSDVSSKKKNIKGMDGVLPVSELFYRSSQSLTEEAPPGSADDEELPFSAEQSDSLMTDSGGVQIRRNEAPVTAAQQQQPPKRRRSRKMVRRGMEMLVGGVPINVDPPQRSVELSYRFDESDWAQVISLNSRDFGPLLHQTSAAEVTPIERGIYCESFVHNAIKWDVCPKDMREIVKQHHVQRSSLTYTTLLEEVNRVTNDTDYDDDDAADEDSAKDVWEREMTLPLSTGTDAAAQHFLDRPDMPFAYHFSIIGISKEEFVSIPDERALERVILRTIVLVAKDKLLVDDFVLSANKLVLEDDPSSIEPTTKISLNFHFEADGEEEDMLPVAQSIKHVLTQAFDDGSFGEFIAEAASEEFSWPEGLLDRLGDECLFESNEETKDSNTRTRAQSVLADAPKEPTESPVSNDGPFGMDSRETDSSDLFLGGGNDGVFFDYSAANIDNSPFQGNLGPLLLDAAVERAKQRYPRVIAIGDVHGCIDELQDLLRLCDYQPGDLVCFLGDLVCKGPDSISVVQMAREIGALGIRGNHDFEVVRWYQAIQSGVDPPVVGSEHFHIASCLSKADMKWLYSLPWYISSKDLGALFVHAGFVAGIRLAKQNPRLMMNMRSILPDGTVTSKFFSNWPWARLWDGPQTVLFGHDADRGLQQYEHAIGLDTGCVYGGRLTACILPEKRLVSVSARREYFKYRRRHYD